MPGKALASQEDENPLTESERNSKTVVKRIKQSDHKERERKTTPTIVKEKVKYKTDRHKHCQQKKTYKQQKYQSLHKKDYSY